MKFSLDIKRSEQLANICGSLDKNLENIANNLNVTISNKGADFNIKGNNAAEAVSVLQDLLLISEKKTIDEKKELQLNKFDHYLVPIMEWHQISNPFKVKAHIIEIQYGKDCLEDDIERE